MKKITKEIVKTIAMYAIFTAILGFFAMQPARTAEASPSAVYTEYADTECHPSIEEIEDGIIRQMFYAICKKETRLDSSKVNRAEDAVGIAQIRRIMVDDANRIVGFDRFSYMDRLSVRESYEMFKVVVLHYCRELSFDAVIDRWNPGCGDQYRHDCWEYYMEGIEYEF